jgi:hypothetical protein
MARSALDNLQTYQTPKERLRRAFWALLNVVVVTYLSWDLSVYLIKFFETGHVSRLITPSLLAVALVYTLHLADLKRRWWLAIPTVLALAAPVVLHTLDRGVQPNSRLLSDTYESALGRAPYSPPKPER